MLEIAPSILSADFAHLAEELRRIEDGGADWVHVDVMDGHFVPNLTMGPPIVHAMKGATRLPLDCHLMIEDADRWITAFRDAGAARLTVHVEACRHLHRTVASIRDAGARAGVALNPATPVEVLDDILAELDLVLVMSVNPGFAGQRFIERSIDKVRRAQERIQAGGHRAIIQVDGGVTTANAQALVAAGARSLVAASAVFGTKDRTQAVRALRAAAEIGLGRAKT